MFHDQHPEIIATKLIRLNSSDLHILCRLLLQVLKDDNNHYNEINELEFNTNAFRSNMETIKLARTILVARRRRNSIFKRAMFGEPAWDMLLALYIGHEDGPRHSVGRLSALSGSPPTTALRWLDYLEKERLVIRESNPTDRRSDFVALTQKGRSMMEQYLSETLQSLA